MVDLFWSFPGSFYEVRRSVMTIFECSVVLGFGYRKDKLSMAFRQNVHAWQEIINNSSKDVLTCWEYHQHISPDHVASDSISLKIGLRLLGGDVLDGHW